MIDKKEAGELKTLKDMTPVKQNELTPEMENKLKEFAMDKAKEIELVLIHKIKEHTEIVEGKFVWKAELRVDLQEKKEVIKNLENEINMAFKDFERKLEADSLVTKSLYLPSLKNKIDDIFRKKRLL